MDHTNTQKEVRPLLVEGVGCIDEYGSYMHSMWEKGLVYFLRDMAQQEIKLQLERGGDVRSLTEQLNRLNSELSVWEANGGRVE